MANIMSCLRMDVRILDLQALGEGQKVGWTVFSFNSCSDMRVQAAGGDAGRRGRFIEHDLLGCGSASDFSVNLDIVGHGGLVHGGRRGTERPCRLRLISQRYV